MARADMAAVDVVEEDAAGDSVAIQGDSVEVGFMAAVSEDVLLDSLVETALGAVALVDSLVYRAEVSVAGVALVAESVAVV